MTPAEKGRFRELLFHYWFDRHQDDRHIVVEVLTHESRTGNRDFTELLGRFLDSGESDAEKSEVICSTLRRHFSNRNTAPVQWLRGIRDLLDMGL